MTLLIASTLMAAVAAFVVIHPILARRGALIRDVKGDGVFDAEVRKRLALTELREVEYDYLGGKLDDADYHSLRERLSREALAAIRAAEAAGAAAGGSSDAVPPPAAATEAEAHGCGFVNPSGSRFCAGCGSRLA